MFIVNFKLNMRRIIYTTILFVIIAIIIFSISTSSFIPTIASKVATTDYIITTSNFTTMLKKIYDNVDESSNKSIKVSGFVFRLEDFNDKQIVIGRNYTLDGQDKVVGFMCEYDKASELKNDTWYEIQGKLSKGDYHGNLPVIKIETIKQIDTPKNTYVRDK